MVNGTAAIARSAVLADVLDAPIPKLTMGDNINVSKNLLDAWALFSPKSVHSIVIGCNMGMKEITYLVFF